LTTSMSISRWEYEIGTYHRMYSRGSGLDVCMAHPTYCISLAQQEEQVNQA
jgi:hypothetical protein